MPHRKRHEAPEARTNQGRVRLAQRAHPGAVYRHEQLLASALRALQPAHHLVMRVYWRGDSKPNYIDEDLLGEVYSS